MFGRLLNTHMHPEIFMKKTLTVSLMLASSILLSSHVSAADAPKPGAQMPVEMQQMMKVYSPELRQKVMALSPN